MGKSEFTVTSEQIEHLKTVSSLYILYRVEDVFLRFTKFCWLTMFTQ